MTSANQWHKLLEVYFAVKCIYTASEEIDEELKTNLQPLNEFKAALDHIMRVMATEDQEQLPGISTDDLPLDFADQNLRSATSHMYRAFFDTCDSASISYRERIRNGLEGFSKEAISTALPDYYPTIRPRINEINMEIASMRSNKGQQPESEKHNISHYMDLIDELAGYCKKVDMAQASLIELKRMEDERVNQERKSQRFYGVTMPALCTIGGVVLGAALTIALVFFGITGN